LWIALTAAAAKPPSLEYWITSGAGVQLLKTAGIIPVSTQTKASRPSVEAGIVTNADDGAAKIASAFIKGISQHRQWDRELAI
jgi:hypothetical protein